MFVSLTPLQCLDQGPLTPHHLTTVVQHSIPFPRLLPSLGCDISKKKDWVGSYLATSEKCCDPPSNLTILMLTKDMTALPPPIGCLLQLRCSKFYLYPNQPTHKSDIVSKTLFCPGPETYGLVPKTTLHCPIATLYGKYCWMVNPCGIDYVIASSCWCWRRGNSH